MMRDALMPILAAPFIALCLMLALDPGGTFFARWANLTVAIIGCWAFYWMPRRRR